MEKSKTKNFKSFPVYMPLLMYKKFKSRCVYQGTDMNKVIRKLVRDYLNGKQS